VESMKSKKHGKYFSTSSVAFSASLFCRLSFVELYLHFS
jgi:hypothetical protein